MALALWPALAVRRQPVPALGREQRRPPGGCAVRGSARGAAVTAAVLLGLVGWFGVEFFTDGSWIGLTERLAAAAEAGVPLAAVLTALAGERRSGPSGLR
nr:hypothetical protein [Micromonospora tarensis]